VVKPDHPVEHGPCGSIQHGVSLLKTSSHTRSFARQPTKAEVTAHNRNNRARVWNRLIETLHMPEHWRIKLSSRPCDAVQLVSHEMIETEAILHIELWPPGAFRGPGTERTVTATRHPIRRRSASTASQNLWKRTLVPHRAFMVVSGDAYPTTAAAWSARPHVG
jgi:hypothetical protein